MHAIIGVEKGELEGVHNAQARRGCIIAVSIPRSPRTVVTQHSSKFGVPSLRKSTRSYESTASVPSYVLFVGRVYLKVGGRKDR